MKINFSCLQNCFTLPFLVVLQRGIATPPPEKCLPCKKVSKLSKCEGFSSNTHYTLSDCGQVTCPAANVLICREAKNTMLTRMQGGHYKITQANTQKGAVGALSPRGAK